MEGFRRRLPILVGTLLILAGCVVKLYPSACSLYRDCIAGEAIEKYRQDISRISEQEKKQSQKEAEEYNRILADEALHLGKAENRQDKAEYKDLLASTEAMAYLEIPSIELRLPVYHGTDEETLKKGAGHMEGTSLPTGGRNVHCVISGHTGVPGAELFTRLDELKEGDRFYLYEMDQRLSYQVDQIVTVLPEETEAIAIEEGRDYVTLLTCIPYGINSHRLLVRGVRTEDGGGTEIYIKFPFSSEILLIFIVSGTAVLFLLDIILVLKFSTGKKHQEGKDLLPCGFQKKHRELRSAFIWLQREKMTKPCGRKRLQTAAFL